MTADEGGGAGGALFVLAMIVGTPYILVEMLGRPNLNLEDWHFPLTNRFCFKWYYIFAFTLIPWLRPHVIGWIKAALQRVQSKYKSVSNDEYYEDEFDAKVIDLLTSFSSDILPSDLWFIVLSFSHSTQQKVKIIKEEEDVRQERKTNRLESIRFKWHKVYAVFVICLHLTSFVILMYEYGHWYQLHKAELDDLKKYFIWNGYTQFVVLLTFHPAFKCLDIAMWFAKRNEIDPDSQWSERRRRSTLFIYNTVVIGVEAAIICCYLLAGIAILVYCGTMFTIWIWAALFALVLFVLWLQQVFHIESPLCLNRLDAETQFKWKRELLLYALCNLCYVFINFCSWFTVAYFISDRYLVSVRYVFASEYCPRQIVVDWTDWKMVFLLLHWCLF